MENINTKNILIAIGAVFATFIFLFVVYKLTNTPVPTSFPEINVIRSNDHIKWKNNSKNILVEYSDFECPACRDRHNFLNEFEKTATPNATLVLRNFPLYQIHPMAEKAAYAAEAAGLQNKYWEMGDLLFNTQDSWSVLGDPTNYFIDLAKKLNLDIEKFKTDSNSQAVKNKVDADIAEGNKAGIDSTPTFFLNGEKLDNITSLDQFSKLLKSL